VDSQKGASPCNNLFIIFRLSFKKLLVFFPDVIARNERMTLIRLTVHSAHGSGAQNQPPTADQRRNTVVFHFAYHISVRKISDSKLLFGSH
jgi:hypothetical protein